MSHPEQAASVVSRLFFTWVTPLLKLGAQRPLEMADLFGVAPQDEPDIFVQRFKDEWPTRMQRHADWWALATALWAIAWKEWAMITLVSLVAVLTNLAIPVTFSWLILFIGDEKASWSEGLLYIGLIALTSIAHFLSTEFAYFLAQRAHIHIESMLALMVYRKSLRLQHVSKGNAANVMNVDPSRVASMAWFSRFVVSAPIQLTLAIYLLYGWLGPSAFVSLAVVLLLMPIKFLIFQAFNSYEEKIMEHKDERVRQLTEALQGMLIVKLFCWEYHVLKQISEVRAKEVSALKKFSYLVAFLIFLIVSTSTIISVGTFSVYTLLGNQLVAARVFPSISLFSSLTDTIMQVPGILSHWSEAKISLARLDKFLRRRELEQRSDVTHNSQETSHKQALDSSSDAANVLSIVAGVFEWEAPDHDEDDEDAETEEGKAEKAAKPASALGEADTALLLDMDDQPLEEMAAEGNQSPSEPFKLREINMEVRRGELVTVIGRVGSGKTSLLNSMLGEMKHVAGHLTRNASALSYVSQRPWIRNATVRDNIVCGQPFDRELYDDVIRVCALTDDLRVLPAGDSTEIGEKGVNLSGGQKQRISLARAVYISCLQHSDGHNDGCVILLDDVLSAVDAHVGHHIFHECLLGKLSQITRVLVTHQLQYLPFVDRIYVMNDGTVQASGTYQQLQEQGVDFVGLLQAEAEEKTKGKAVEAEKATDDQALADDDVLEGGTGADVAAVETRVESGPLVDDGEGEAALKEKGRLIDEEERNTGEVKSSVYLEYMRSTGGLGLLSLLVLSSLLFQGANLFDQVWLSRWSDSSGNTVFYLSIYLSSAVLGGLMSLARQTLWTKGTLNCARKMHDRLLEAILRAPMTFFFTTPTGRIVTRFSKDQSTVDQVVPDMMSDFFLCLLAIMGMLLVICGVLPWFLVPAALMLALYWWVLKYYRKTSTELGRLQSLSSSPIYAQYSETLDGLDTIRAFHWQGALKRENQDLVVANQRVDYCVFASDCWLGGRIRALGLFIIIGVSVLSVVTRGSLSQGLVGLVLALSQSIIGDMEWFVQSGAMLESSMNQVERIQYYTATPPEAPLSLAPGQTWDAAHKCIVQRVLAELAGYDEDDGDRDDREWPSEGRIEFNNVWLRYRDDLGHVLQGISLTIDARHKVGVVGRTGAGKSSLINALFRLVELDSGTITIDGRDISRLGLHQLRSALAIIPQDPVLFSGTIRSNLDPFGVHAAEQGDAALWDALEKVRLSEFVHGLPLGLEAKVETNGQNLSVGQRQLVCMARALLRDCRVLILDEATASVDNKTDRAIQETLRHEFGGRTVVVIAHRLHTVIDMDCIIVMDEGRVLQYGPPGDLLATEGPFARLVDQTGAVSAQYLRSMARRADRKSVV